MASSGRFPATGRRIRAPNAIPLSTQARAAIAEAPVIMVSKADLAAGVPHHGKHRDLAFSTTGNAPVSGYTKGKAWLDAAMLAIAREEAAEKAAKRGEDPADMELKPWTFHDLRRTAASGMARLGIDLPVMERRLNHVSGSFAGVVGIYQRHSFEDEMRMAFATWGAHVEAVATGKRESNVTPLAARRRR